VWAGARLEYPAHLVSASLMSPFGFQGHVGSVSQWPGHRYRHTKICCVARSFLAAAVHLITRAFIVYASVPICQNVTGAVPQKLWRKPTAATLHDLARLHHCDGSAGWTVDHYAQCVCQARSFTGAGLYLFQSLLRRRLSLPPSAAPSDWL
jgi:hypothetical protein